MMKSYMRSHLRDSLKTLLYLVAFSVAVTLIFSGSNQCYPNEDYIDGEWIVTGYYYSSMLGIPVTILAISCFALPVLEFSFFKKRRNLDCAYALPISRREMGIVHYLTGLLLLVIPYTCSYLINFLLMLRYPGAFDYRLLFEHYILCMLLGICIYSVYVFVFNEANSTGDGVWFIILWTFVFYLIARALFGISYYDNLSEMGISFMALNGFTASYMDIIDGDRVALTADIWENTKGMIYISLWLVLGILSMIGHYLTFGKRPAQHTEEVSDSWFGYRVMIPIYAVCGMVLWQDIGAWLIVEVIAVVGYMIYRKGLHLKKSDWISLAVFPVIAYIMTTVTALLYWN